MSCWWSDYRRAWFALTTLVTPWRRRGPKIYHSGDFRFRAKEIDGHFDEIEEQLWAFRNGLSNIMFTIKISLPRCRRKK